MGKCLVTNFDGVVNNDSLETYGKIRIGISKISSPTQWTQGFSLTFSKDTNIKLIGNGYFTDTTLIQNLGKVLTVKANVRTVVEVSNMDCSLEIDKYNLTYFNDYGEDNEPNVIYPEKNKTIDSIEEFQYSTGITQILLHSTQVSGDVSKLSTLVNLTYLNLNNTQVSGDVSKLNTLTSLTNLNLYNTQVSGDVSKLNTLTSLTNLNLYNTQVSGDVSKLSTLVNLTYLNLNNTQVSGDVSKLNTLTSLTNLKISSTQVSLTRDISFINGMSELKECTFNNFKLTGDLATIPSKVKLCSFQNDAGSTLTWSSRPTSANIIAIEGTASCANIDTMLINQAQCVKAFTSSDGSWYKAISLSGTRTSASDDAVAKLQQMGYTIAITKA